MTRQIRSNDYVSVLGICRQLYDVLLRRRAPALRIKNAVSSDFGGTPSQHAIIHIWGESRIWGWGSGGE